MRVIAEDKAKSRRSRVPAGQVGARLVMDELLRRGFDARLVGCYTKNMTFLRTIWLATKARSCEGGKCGSLVCPQFALEP